MSLSIQESDFDGAQDSWESILSFCAAHTFYVTPSWQRVWWRHFGKGFELHILKVLDGDVLIGIASMKYSNGVLSFVGNSDLFDYNDFLVVDGRDAEFYSAVWDYISGLKWDSLELGSLPETSPTIQFIQEKAEQIGLTVECLEEDKAPFSDLPASWEEFVSGLSKKHRHELRRKIRRIESAGEITQKVFTKPDDVANMMPKFANLLRSSSQDKALFLTPERERFFEDAVFELAKSGQLRLSFLKFNGVDVASNIVIDYKNSYLLYNSGYDPAHSALSVGLVNKALTIKEGIEFGKCRFDFLRGTERYKYDLGAENSTVYRLTVRR
ncbi:MAG: GNAT family N-acetyltransferase [SAR202 cluster bacterium]|nr:GNAT family N-acetyltransferase [SAR202 cluster bacterium]